MLRYDADGERHIDQACQDAAGKHFCGRLERRVSLSFRRHQPSDAKIADGKRKERTPSVA